MASASSLAAQQIGAQAAAEAAQAVVARLSFLEGEVRVTAVEKAIDPADAALNMPLWPGQSIESGHNGAAEVEFQDGSVLRITEKSGISLLRLQPETQVGLEDGLYYLELRAGGQVPFTVFAGELSIAPAENASFRIRVQGGQPEVAVLRGSVTVTRSNSYTVDLTGGESLRTDPKDNHRYLLADGVGPEPWDHWNEARAQALLDATTAQTIAREDFAGNQGYGWSDLDAGGTWYSMPGEGLVWQPYGVDASFDPYGYGNWVYGSTGYVWASGYAWGWLPFRCGRWTFFSGFGWAWQPASGCRSYGGGSTGGWFSGGSGGGWGGGGVPVNRPPRGWRPPTPPPQQISTGSGIHIKRPTIPVAPLEGGPLSRKLAGGIPRRAQPVQVGDVLLRPLSPVLRPVTPQGGSAVGSSLRRDYPIGTASHQPILGVDGGGATTVPGRPVEWRGTVAARGPRDGIRAPAAPGTVSGFPVVSTPGVVVLDGPVSIGAPAWRRGGVNAARNPPNTGNAPSGAAGSAPLGASGAAPGGASGSAPTGANGVPPLGAAGAPPHTGRERGGYGNGQYGIGGAGATPYGGGLPSTPMVREPLRVPQRIPENPAPVRQMPISPPQPRMSMPPPPPSPPPQIRTAPSPQPMSQPGIRINPK